jgi:hypothetical protein
MITKNNKWARLPQARRIPLPELAEFLAPLRVYFTQGPSAQTLRQYLTGLLRNCLKRSGVDSFGVWNIRPIQVI